MAIARAELADSTVTRRYHYVSRCDRKAFFKLVEYTGRLLRQEKGSISAVLGEIFDRLGFSSLGGQSG
jgi:hypothetical protein